MTWAELELELSKATPTPWNLIDLEGLTLAIESVDGDLVAEINGKDEEGRSNAALIVEAVNSIAKARTCKCGMKFCNSAVYALHFMECHLPAIEAANAKLRAALEAAPDTFSPSAFDYILGLCRDHRCGFTDNFEKFIRDYWVWYDRTRAEALKEKP